MNFYDFHVHSEFSEGESTIEEIANRAKLLGYKGICFTTYLDDKNKIKKTKEIVSKLSKQIGIEIFIGFEARNMSELDKLIRFRREYDVLLVKGSDLLLNRKAVETKEVDILTHPEYNRRDSGFNHVMAQLATENNVAIEINFREILNSSKNTRANIMHKIKTNVEICKKYKVPVIICSGSVTHWQLKDPKILISMGCLLGLELKEAKKTISEIPENIIKMIKERQDEKWIRPGVKVV
ncbi:MAG: PHP domain-containing protein [Candidatus Aenigmarchaeota archaeon]|nr:PHP domain-containing protein [Candidatus Aenigmarchaeota archaeon]